MERTHYHPLKTDPCKYFIQRNLEISSSMKKIFESFFPDRGMGNVLEFGTSGNFHSYLAANKVGCDSYISINSDCCDPDLYSHSIESICVTDAKDEVEDILGYDIPKDFVKYDGVKSNFAHMPVAKDSVDVVTVLGLGAYDNIRPRGCDNNVGKPGEFGIEYMQDFGDVPYSRALKGAVKSLKKGGLFFITDHLIDMHGQQRNDTTYIQEAKHMLESMGLREEKISLGQPIGELGYSGTEGPHSKTIAMRKP